MKGTELADCLSKANYLNTKLKMLADDIVTIGSEEGEHYLIGAMDHIYKACGMLRRYCIFIKEDDDEEAVCGTSDADAECDAGGVRA